MGMKGEEPDYQKQFEAAVRVIQGLPRNGSYRPPYDEMLCFYGYYKQATVGQCKISRPGFWDPVGRYKWGAWNRLGTMTRKEAMVAYVQEMKKSAQKVIDTVPLDETAEDMFDYFRPLYEVIDDMPRPPESFFKKKLGLGRAEDSVKSAQGTSDSESDVFCDSLEQVEAEQAKRLSAPAEGSFSSNDLHEIPAREDGGHQATGHVPISAKEEGLSKSDVETAPVERDVGSSPMDASESPTGPSIQQEVDTQMRSTLRALQDDMEEVMRRLSHLESLAALQGQASKSANGTPSHWHKDVPWRAAHLTPPTLLFLLAWPFVVQWLLWRFQSQKR